MYSAELPPVVERELRVAARKGGTYWSRVGAALTAIVITGWWFAGPATLGLSPQAGRTAFRVLALLAALMIVTSVIRLTAEAFAREKREDTLGLLFLTPLKPRDLVLGKLVSSGLGAFYRFVAVVPVLALPMLGGGVTFREFALLVLVLSNLAFFTATLGLHVSAHCWDEKRAGTVATITLVGLTILLPLLGTAFFRGLTGWGTGLVWFYGASPAYPLWQATVTGVVQPAPFWCSLLLTNIGGWLFLRATCRMLPRCWQARPRLLEVGRHSRHIREDQLATQTPHAFTRAGSARPIPAARKAVRRQFDSARSAAMLDQHPIVWFALRWRAEAASAWIVGAVGLVGFVGVGMAQQFEAYLTPEFALFIVYFLNAALKTYVSEQAALAFARDRAENSLELLLATPLMPRELVQGYLLAVRGPLRKLVRRMLFIEAGWLALTLLVAGNWRREETQLTAAAGAAMLALLIPDLYSVGWAALWEGVIAKDSRTAASSAVMKVLCLPWLFALGLLPLAHVLGWLTSPWFLFSAVVLGSMLTDWWFKRRAQRNLSQELLNHAQRRASGETEFYGGWERLGRWLGQRWRSAASRGTG